MTKDLKVAEFINTGGKVLTCRLNDTLKSAKTIMVLNDYSQLPVLNDDGKVEGAISWKSIGKAEVVGSLGDLVSSCLEKPPIVRMDENFIKYIKLIAKKDYILVKDEDEKIRGIITTYDMTIYFSEFLVPFLKIGIIEDCIRRLIVKHSWTTPKNKKVNSLIFHEYKDLFRKEENWKSLNFFHIDKDVFIDKLSEIQQIRNNIAHYKPDYVSKNDLSVLNSFTDIIQKLP